MKIRGEAGIFHVTSKKELIDLIAQAPDDVLLAPNQVGNISMYRHDFGDALFVGYIAIEEKEIVIFDEIEEKQDEEI